MNLSIEFSKPEITSSFDWQLSQEINVTNDAGEVIAKADIELITLNKHRDSAKSYQLLESLGSTDWEIPLNLYFKGQNLAPELCEKFAIQADTKKAKTHIMLETISVLPAYRNKGIATFILAEIAKHHPKVQSITVFSMSMHTFVDAEACETEADRDYYQRLNLQDAQISSSQLHEFFIKSHFIEFSVDAELLAEPLPFEIFITTPNTLTR